MCEQCKTKTLDMLSISALEALGRQIAAELFRRTRLAKLPDIDHDAGPSPEAEPS